MNNSQWGMQQQAPQQQANQWGMDSNQWGMQQQQQAPQQQMNTNQWGMGTNQWGQQAQGGFDNQMWGQQQNDPWGTQDNSWGQEASQQGWAQDISPWGAKDAETEFGFELENAGDDEIDGEVEVEDLLGEIEGDDEAEDDGKAETKNISASLGFGDFGGFGYDPSGYVEMSQGEMPAEWGSMPSMMNNPFGNKGFGDFADFGLGW